MYLERESEMAFKKCPRSCKTQRGWRLATVEEVQKSLQSNDEAERLATASEVRRSLVSNEEENSLNEFEYERIRLLDGWIGVSSGDLEPKVGFKSCVGYMLLVQCRNPNVSGSGDIEMGLYSDVHLDEKGMKAAFFLCCEDWNYEVVYWLLNCWSKDENQKFRVTGNPGILGDMMLKASEDVSKVAMALHSTRPLNRVQKTDYTVSSMRSMVSGIIKLFYEKIKGQEFEFLDRLYWGTLGADLGGQCWEEMGLTTDLARFQEFNFKTKEDWEEIADIVWYVIADSLAVFTVRDLIGYYMEIDIDELHSTSQNMDDQAFVFSIMASGNELLHKTFFGTDSLWKVIKKAATTAAGDCKLFKERVRREGYGTYSYEGKYGVLNSVLVGAAKRGDANLVERLLEYGVEPLDTDDVRKKTALHRAVNLVSEDEALRIAATLLTREKETSKTLANVPDYRKRIALHTAACLGHKKVCEVLLLCNSDIRAKDEKGQNPLHYAVMRGQENDEVITLLISEYRDKLSDIDADTTEERMERGGLVDDKDTNGKTPLDRAVEYEGNSLTMLAGLLSESNKPQDYFEKLDLSSYLRESSINGYVTLVEKLLESGADPLERDSEGRTALHYAAEGQNEGSAVKIISSLLFDGEQLKNLELARASDKYGRNVLHVAAFVGHENLCEWLLSLENLGLKLDTKDRDDQSALYYAVAGDHDNDSVLDVLIFRGASGQGFTNVRTKDASGTTPLHTAAEQGNYRMVERLLSKRLIPQQKDRQSYVRMADVLGQTALHKAASGGHVRVVKKLLEEKAHPLKERDCDGKTALHHAVQAENEEDAMTIVELLLQKCDEKEKSLLLFASAVSLGYAEERLESKPMLQLLILKQKEEITNKPGINLVRLAAESGNIDMTRELLTRGASIDDILGDDWISEFTEDRKNNVRKVQNQIVNMFEHGTDKPTLLDNLGRSAFADGLAALFLNPFVRSPITVGISGEWGMGKSSLMIQTESILLKTAAHLAFTDLLQTDVFPGSKKSKSSVKNVKLSQSIQRRLGSKGVTGIWDFLNNYQDEHAAIFKSLAVMDHRDTVENESTDEDFKSEGKMQIKIPSILTVRYNAWNYRNESEAWAGLAIEITKELESTMTVAQRLRTSWRYTWANRRRIIWVDVILPFCFAIILAIWASVILWLVLDRVKGGNVKYVKYGSFPLALIAVVRTVAKSAMSVVKPISSHMLDYMSLPDHSQKLGYHHKVRDDIIFLKKELGRKPSRLWNVFAFMWCCCAFSFNDDYIPHTKIPKTTPASHTNLRMIVFVDNLDRCQESVVLQIISAVNLVLAACEINVVLGMDKSMIERAIIRMHGDRSSQPNKTSQDMADKYLRKIIQLPLDLPDPSDSESLSFLEEQLGAPATQKKASESPAGTQMQNVHASRKRNRKFLMGTSRPNDSKIDISSSPWKSGLNPHGVPEEIENISDKRSAGEGSTSAEEQEQEEAAHGESGYTQRDTTITMPPAENQCTGDPIPNTTSDRSRIGLVKKLTSRFAHKQPENPPTVEQHPKLPPIPSELLLPKYSKGERDAFFFLRDQATTSRKLPREWKRFLNYHRLVWNVLFLSREVKAVAGWQVQLIAWVFACWQWKDRIDTLIQKWDKLTVLRNWIPINEDDREREQHIGPSLRDIVEHYMEERWPMLKTSTSNEATLPKAEAAAKEHATNIIEKEELVDDSTNLPLPREIPTSEDPEERENEPIEELANDKGELFRGEEEDKAENSLHHDRQIKTSKEKKLSKKAEGKGKSKVIEEEEEEDKELEEWKKLKQTLRKYNVSMDGIQAFQKFRFYCVPGHLHWPLPESSRL